MYFSEKVELLVDMCSGDINNFMGPSNGWMWVLLTVSITDEPNNEWTYDLVIVKKHWRAKHLVNVCICNGPLYREEPSNKWKCVLVTASSTEEPDICSIDQFVVSSGNTDRTWSSSID